MKERNDTQQNRDRGLLFFCLVFVYFEYQVLLQSERSTFPVSVSFIFRYIAFQLSILLPLKFHIATSTNNSIDSLFEGLDIHHASGLLRRWKNFSQKIGIKRNYTSLGKKSPKIERAPSYNTLDLHSLLPLEIFLHFFV